MFSLYLAPFVIAAIIAGGLTFWVRTLAQRFNIVDKPNERKIHQTPIPRLGGVAIVGAFLLLVIGYGLVTPRFNFVSSHIFLFDKNLFGVILGVLVLAVVGIIDDAKGLSAWNKLAWQVLAAVLVVAFGIGIEYIRLPGGLHWDLDTWVIPFSLLGQSFNFVVWSDLVTIFWIVLMINTVNFLDGLDGLAGGISFIAAITLFFLSFSLGQPAAALLGVIFAGSILGFLPWNFNPAKIFMGDSGSMFLGFILGVLSVISGAKLATAFLVLGIPLLDVIWVIIRRILTGKSPFRADKLHLHHRLLDAGFSQKQTAIILYLGAAVFGIIALFSDTQDKVRAVIWLGVLMLILAAALVILTWRKKLKSKNS